MVKGHLTGCGLHGDSLVVYVLFNRSILLFVFNFFSCFKLGLVCLFACFVLFVYITVGAVEEHIKCELSGEGLLDLNTF